MNILKPERLRKGDLIGLISPASPPSAQEKIDKGVRYLETLGYRTIVGKHAMAQNGYLAGTDEERAGDLNEMICNPQVKAIFAIRGGYGTPRLLHLVDYRSLRRHPKIIVGYSDLTALQLSIFKKTGLVTFSGPMVGVELWDSFDPFSEEHFWRVLTSTKKIGTLKNPDNEPLTSHGTGKASGLLLGGNFSLMMSLLATPYCPDFRKAVLILEDVDEAPHRVDRMIAQLFHAGYFRSIAALVLGKFTDCVPSDPAKPHLTIDQVLEDFLTKVECPTLTNCQYGHIPKKLTIPLGVRAQVDTKNMSFEVLESAVI
ncbi:MAG: LD-carboxypeptidase [bacterium]